MNLQTRTMSHGNGPSSSHGAAEDLVSSGFHKTQCGDVFRLLRQYPNRTALKLAMLLKCSEKYKAWDLHRVVTMVRRRLHDLELKELATSDPLAEGPLRWTATEEG